MKRTGGPEALAMAPLGTHGPTREAAELERELTMDYIRMSPVTGLCSSFLYVRNSNDCRHCNQNSPSMVNYLPHQAKYAMLALAYSGIVSESTGQAPDWMWLTGAGGTGTANAIGSATDMYGYTYVCGYYSASTMTIGSYVLSNQGGEDMFLAKYAPDGSVYWAASFGGSGDDRANDIVCYGSDELMLTGVFSSTVNLGNIPLTSVGGKDAFVASFNGLTGSSTWATTIGGMGNEEGLSISGNMSEFSIAGIFNSPSIEFGPDYVESLTNSSGIGAVFFGKYTAQSIAWAGRVIADDGFLRDPVTAIDVDGALYISGSFTSSSVSFEGQYSTPNSMNGMEDAYIAKYDISGTYAWSVGWGESWTMEYVRDCEVGSDGGLIVSGNTTYVGNPPYPSSFTIWKYTSQGEQQWATYGGGPSCNSGDSASRIAADNLGNIYITGTYCGPFEFGSTYISGMYGIFVAKVDSNGNPIWATSLNSNSDNNANICSGVSLDFYRNIYITGAFAGSLSNDVSTIYSNGTDHELFVGKICAIASLDTTAVITGPTELCAGTPVTFSIDAQDSVEWVNWTLPVGWLGTSQTSSIVAVPNDQGGVVTVDRGNSCMTDQSTLFVNVYPQPNFVYSVNDMVVNFSMLDQECVITGQGFTWDYGNGTQNTLAPNPTWTYANPGSYSACLNCVYSGCTACGIVTVPGNYVGGSAGWVGINESQYDEILTCYPNPTSDYLFFSGMDESVGPLVIRITDGLGRLAKSTVLRSRNEGVSVSELANGHYLVSIQSAKELVRQPFLITR